MQGVSRTITYPAFQGRNPRLRMGPHPVTEGQMTNSATRARLHYSPLRNHFHDLGKRERVGALDHD